MASPSSDSTPDHHRGSLNKKRAGNPFVRHQFPAPSSLNGVRLLVACYSVKESRLGTKMLQFQTSLLSTSLNHLYLPSTPYLSYPYLEYQFPNKSFHPYLFCCVIDSNPFLFPCILCINTLTAQHQPQIIIQSWISTPWIITHACQIPRSHGLPSSPQSHPLAKSQR